VAHHDGKVSKALKDLFPEVTWGTSNQFKSQVWQDVTNRRRFFEEFAQEYKFNPYVLNNWDGHSKKLILLKKHVHSVMKFHQGNVNTTIRDLFTK